MKQSDQLARLTAVEDVTVVNVEEDSMQDLYSATPG